MILKPNATAHMVWTNIETLSCDNQQTYTIELDQKFQNLTLGDLTIAEYCEQMKVILELIANIGLPVPEHILITYHINGLSPNYDSIAPVLRNQDPVPSLLKLMIHLNLRIVHPKLQPPRSTTLHGPCFITQFPLCWKPSKLKNMGLHKQQQPW